VAVTQTSTLDKISKFLLKMSNYTFGAGLVGSNLMRIPVLSQLLAIPVSVLWLIGYGTWYIGSTLYNKQVPRKTESWYGFADFKKQHQISALIGTIATVLCFIVPTLIAPIAWLYTISNIFWAISTHHQYKMPPKDDPNYSTAKQRIYSYLANVTTLMSLITAIAATVVFFLPLTAPILVPIVSGVCGVLTIAVFTLLGKYLLGKFPTDSSLQKQLSSNPSADEVISDLARRAEHQPHPIASLSTTQGNGVTPDSSSANPLLRPPCQL
jgi:hypothetical protein